MRAPRPPGAWDLYCEGFHDRDFLGGLFEDALAQRSLRGDPHIDPGQFGFRSSTDVLTVITQTKGKPQTPLVFRGAVEAAVATRPAGLVLCLDEDEAPTVADARRRARDRIAKIVDGRTFDAPTGTLTLESGHMVRLLPVTWCCADASAAHLPTRQNLERLITAACCEAYPGRGAAVERWLASRSDAPVDAASVSKSFSWSHMAGWFPSPGGNDFFRAVWRDPLIRKALCRRMHDTGVDAVLDAMGVVPPWREDPQQQGRTT